MRGSTDRPEGHGRRYRPLEQPPRRIENQRDRHGRQRSRQDIQGGKTIAAGMNVDEPDRPTVFVHAMRDAIRPREALSLARQDQTAWRMRFV